MEGLTDRQKETLDYMVDNQMMVCPTYEQASNDLGISRKAMYDRVEALIKKGFMEKVSINNYKTRLIIKEEV